jgi:hypothetical protein
MSILYSRIAGRYGAIGLLFLVLSFASSASAQVAAYPNIKPQFLNNSGQPCSGCKLQTYIAGTSTSQVTYADALGSVPNPAPVVLDATGRAFIFLTSAAYKFVLQSPGGTTYWSVDNVTATNLSLLASNNTFTGSNTFNGPVTTNSTTTFNAGFTANGPANLTAGGSMTGNFTGNPVFQGTPFFNNGFMVNQNATFNGAIISTVPTGNAPFIIASSTVVTNLDANFLEGNDWASPAAIGGTTPQTGVFTQLRANTSFQIASGPLFNGTQGTDTHVLSAGTVSGTGNTLCVDANGGATTSGCTVSTKAISTGKLGTSSCTPASSSFSTCTSVITISPAQPDTNYIPSCTGQAPGDPRMIIEWAAPTSTTTITATVETMGSISAPFSDIFCSAISNH